ncbi:Alkaline phosphatase D precursor [Rubripirellula lacrimiformis]|uniref:Alkaline phosphatase D n=1 Tax=Rubripirellula lacrimiformis TaxID=1930273 RepID=A0A517N9H0_9BACT|nr:alkaline phosphatase D family protein [Rubripirellula lacrimiformis]QDT03786.1 Alkaline phosphatase D precursor [Rubripirellula lacrimiformis]
MQNTKIKPWLCGVAVLMTCSALHAEAPSSRAEPLSRIVFGSCIKQDQPTPIFQPMLAAKPELLLFTGDNIYGDTDDMPTLRAKYDKLARNPSFAALRNACPVLATWDDHDYGANDGGADYAKREESQTEFLEFWQTPQQSPLRKRSGVYDAKIFGPAGQRTQVILLDTRYFRSALKTGDRRVGGPYVPDDTPTKTMLGDQQWQWLKVQLQQPAQLRLIVSSIQFVASSAGQECWANLPLQRKQMMDLVQSTRATGVLLISGDRHWSEISSVTPDGGYPMIDVTCSSLNQLHARGTPTENDFRISNTYHRENFGILSVDWQDSDPLVQISVRDIEGKPRIEKTIRLSELSLQ